MSFESVSFAAVKTTKKKLEEALREILRRDQLLDYQNNGRWNVDCEHERRARNVIQTNIKIAEQALGIYDWDWHDKKNES